MDDEFTIKYIFFKPLKSTYHDNWELYSNVRTPTAVKKGMLIRFWGIVVIEICLWVIYRILRLDVFFLIKKGTYFILGFALAIICGPIYDRAIILVITLMLKRRLKKADIELGTEVVFEQSKIKLTMPKCNTIELNYNNLLEKPDEFVIGGIIRIQKNELKASEVEFISKKAV